MAQWSKQMRARQVQSTILYDAPTASWGSKACLPTDQARVREEVAVAPKEGIERFHSHDQIYISP